ncbi:hypothetical protein Vadar_027378 [Vaccinium darrowii]|uniref:Uncharacterized protein n=1 Tax=Vaccinium darrowii TaxID=229202 RepID=A0ACB7Y240_9ERIC|nr:hypothetical protein Vadar_027378 [Vaccinium darrowii]
MRMVNEGGERVTDFLKTIPVKHWSTVHFPGCRYGEMFSNVAESFNSWIKDERYLPVKNLVDAIRAKIMSMIVERREKASKWVRNICPKMDQKLFDAYQESRTWVVMPSGDDVYEVHSEPTVTVDIARRTCSCQKWQQNGFPCCHAVGAITNSGKELSLYVDPYYHAETYRASYSYSIYPIPTLWMPQHVSGEDVILPPLSKKPPGRPKTRRIPSRGEKVSQIKCGRCGKFGNHNRATCKEAT